ncbi:cold-shock protein [Pseudochelatococcus sp. G4_1912]|uniref:cold-shock protein n=1 Tax=Pseudochelatococcus sp. G4_1912 TaxID=3114288 RepID=UPI0039C5A9F7
MNRYDDSRDARRRGARRDGFEPRDGGYGQPSHSDNDGGYFNAGAGAGGPAGPAIEATVKWFNPSKGFGFVAASDGSGDAFLSLRALEAAGHGGAEPGACAIVRLRDGPKGPQVAEVVELEDLPPQARPARAPRAPGGFGGGGYGNGGGRDYGNGGGYAGGGYQSRGDAGPSEDINGTVKWYNRDKGFGFVQPDDGGRDVFVHASVLQRAGLTDLAEGQRVQMGVVAGAKGREASNIALD